MLIYILPVNIAAQPKNQPFAYPAHNKDYGVEQDFLVWLNQQKNLLTLNPKDADWHYLPIFWTRWHLNHNFAANDEGIPELQHFANQALINAKKTFTVTQFDGGTLLNLGKTIEFTAAKTINNGIDIPILCSKHKNPIFPIKKKYLASFNGSYNTHPLRKEMKLELEENEQVLMGNNLPTRFYKRWLLGKQFNLNTMGSYLALAPRGTSCNSFRFYEAMQLGVAPILIGDVDVRPFPDFINWEAVSYYVKNIEELTTLLKEVNPQEAIAKGKAAIKLFNNELYYQKWCKYVIKELAQF
jgi:hypothetical protein